MKDIIYREDAIDTLMAIFDKPNHPDYLRTDEICNALNFMPSAQPLERCVATIEFDEEKLKESINEAIVRCKDCKYSSPNKVYGCRIYSFADDLDERMYSDDFCSRAERRTDETD